LRRHSPGRRSSIDRGLDPTETDVLHLGNFSDAFFTHLAHWARIIADLTGLIPKPATRAEGACAPDAQAFRQVVIAIASGHYDMVLVGEVEQMSKRNSEEVAEGLALANTPTQEGLGLPFLACSERFIAGIDRLLLAKRDDRLIMSVTDSVRAFPTLILALAITAALGTSLTNVTIAIGLVITPGFAGLVRSVVLSVREWEYIQSARSMGLNDWEINFQVCVAEYYSNHDRTGVIKRRTGDH
jgi:hypothetical protein